MKISELPRLANPRRDAEIPVAVESENYNITLGQIFDSKSDIIRFGGVAVGGSDVQYVNASPPIYRGLVVFDLSTNSFYYATRTTSTVEGETVTTDIYYKAWNEYSLYYGTDGNIRTDCLFVANDGRLYFSDGESLKSAGITAEQSNQIRHATPIEVASEEEMEQRIAAGEYEEGQLYFLAES